MGRMKNFHKKRWRRTAKQVLKHGKTAKRPHNSPAGRTGKIHDIHLKSFLRDPTLS